MHQKYLLIRVCIFTYTFLSCPKQVPQFLLGEAGGRGGDRSSRGGLSGPLSLSRSSHAPSAGARPGPGRRWATRSRVRRASLPCRVEFPRGPRGPRTRSERIRPPRRWVAKSARARAVPASRLPSPRGDAPVRERGVGRGSTRSSGRTSRGAPLCPSVVGGAKDGRPRRLDTGMRNEALAPPWDRGVGGATTITSSAVSRRTPDPAGTFSRPDGLSDPSRWIIRTFGDAADRGLRSGSPTPSRSWTRMTSPSDRPQPPTSITTSRYRRRSCTLFRPGRRTSPPVVHPRTPCRNRTGHRNRTGQEPGWAGARPMNALIKYRTLSGYGYSGRPSGSPVLPGRTGPRPWGRGRCAVNFRIRCEDPVDRTSVPCRPLFTIPILWIHFRVFRTDWTSTAEAIAEPVPL